MAPPVILDTSTTRTKKLLSYVRVKNTVSSQTFMISDLSENDTIWRLKELAFKYFKVEPGKQRLYFQGKELEDSLSLYYDYSIKNNDTIQLMPKSEKEPLGESQVANIPGKKKVEAEKEKKSEACDVKEAESHYFKVGDELNCKDLETGAWFEAVIKMITENDDVRGVDNLTYYVESEGYGDDMEAPVKVKLDQLRPRAKTKIPLEDLDIKMKIMVNYNVEAPEKRGFWYDAVVTKVLWTDKKLMVTVKGSKDIPHCQISFTDECYKVEPVPYVTADKIRAGVMKCLCKGDETLKCYKCGYRICGGQDNPDELVMCDDCDGGYHTKCLGMSKVPAEDKWFCPLCKRDVDIFGAGGSKQMSKKKLTDTNRVCGKGTACASRTKICYKVAKVTDIYPETEEAKEVEMKRKRCQDGDENDESKPSMKKKAKNNYKFCKEWMGDIEKDENKNLLEQVQSKEVETRKRS